MNRENVYCLSLIPRVPSKIYIHRQQCFLASYVFICTWSTRGQTKSRTTNSRTGQLSDTMLIQYIGVRELTSPRLGFSAS